MQLVQAVLLVLLSPAAAQYNKHRVNLAAHLSQLSAIYGPTAIPLEDNGLVPIKISMMPLQLVDVDSVNTNLEVSALLEVSWPDELMVWNKSEFGNIGFTFIDHTKVWTPQLLIHGAVGSKQTLSVDTQVLLVSDSATRTTVTALWVHEFHFTCEFVMSKFPLDQQVCKLPLTATKFRHPTENTQTYAANINNGMAMSLFMGNSEWNLTGFQLQNGTVDFVQINGNLRDIDTATAVFRIQRYSIYYEVVVTVPLVLLTVLQLLTYLVPLESGEKTGCGVTILLSFTVFLLLIDQIVPKSQQVPVIVYFITIAIVISAVSLVYNCLLLRMYHTSSSTKMPKCVEMLLVQGIGCLMCLRCCESEHSDEGDCNSWRLAAAALERLGFLLHTGCIVAVFVWMQLQL